MARHKSIIVNPEHQVCALCGCRVGLHWHHLLHGTANRRIADKYGLALWLCHTCHENIHSSPHHEWTEIDRALMQLAQERFEEQYSHAQWMELFGKNYYSDRKIALSPYALAS